MITLTMQCERCGKEVSHDMTNDRLDQDVIRKFGFVYSHDGKKSLLICLGCEDLFNGLKDKLEGVMKTELCGFLNGCEKEGKNDGDKDGG